MIPDWPVADVDHETFRQGGEQFQIADLQELDLYRNTQLHHKPGSEITTKNLVMWTKSKKVHKLWFYTQVIFICTMYIYKYTVTMVTLNIHTWRTTECGPYYQVVIMWRCSCEWCFISSIAYYGRRSLLKRTSNSSPPLIRTPLLPSNSVLIREVSFGEREHYIYIHSTCCQECVLSRGVSSLESVL